MLEEMDNEPMGRFGWQAQRETPGRMHACEAYLGCFMLDWPWPVEDIDPPDEKPVPCIHESKTFCKKQERSHGNISYQASNS
jgi:hypothetical protein